MKNKKYSLLEENKVVFLLLKIKARNQNKKHFPKQGNHKSLLFLQATS